MKRSLLLLLAVSFIGLMRNFCTAATVYEEAVDGDFSGDLMTPTSVTLQLGPNTIIGQMGDNGNTGATDGSDADYFTFTIAPGQELTFISIDSYSSPGDPGLSFIGLTNDTQFIDQIGTGLLGSSLFNASVPADLLNVLAFGPLGPGDYSIWLQETVDTTVDYQFTFTLIPEPGAPMMITLAGAGLIVRRRRTRRWR